MDIARLASEEENFLPFLVHDLNNYLHAVGIHIAIAKSHTDKAIVTESLSTAEAGLHLIRLLVQQGFGGKEEHEEVQTIGISSLIHAVTAITRFMASGSGLQYEVLHNGESGSIRFRCNTLLRVLANLLHNAKEAMPAGGKITVSIQHDPGSGAGDRQPGQGCLSIAVRDQGVGIPEENLSRIFVPGFSTKETGRGLGLAFCRDAIEKNGGRLEAASTPGLGSIFTIRLPTRAS